jgi:uncharacterized protein YaaQ
MTHPEDIARACMNEKGSIDRLVIAVVSSDDVGDLAQALIRDGFYFTRVTSHGSLLSEETVSLLIGINSSRQTALLDLIARRCHTRVKFVPAGDSSAFQGQAMMIEAEVGGAIIYTCEVEQFIQY